MKTAILLSLFVTMSGCASMGDSDHASALHTAMQDDEYCTLAGYQYPAQSYVDCRMKLDNSRLYKQWRAMELMQRSTHPNTAAARPGMPVQRFIPVDAGKYRCWPDPQFGSNYIMCGVAGS